MIKIFDCRDRGETICNKCQNLHKQAEHIRYIENIDSKRRLQISNADLVFLHTSNDNAKEMYNLLIQEKIYTVCYSGGKDSPRWFKKTEYSIFKKLVENGNELNLKNFLERFYE